MMQSCGTMNESNWPSRIFMTRMAFALNNFAPQRCYSDKVQRCHGSSHYVKCSLSAEPHAQEGYVIASRRAFISLTAAVALQPVFSQASLAVAKSAISAYDVQVMKNGKPIQLTEYKGKVTLFVNVATYCALTPQYEGLVELHDKFQPEGFEIVASACDQFGHQEPGSNEDICKFAKEKFGAKFLLLDKLNVNDGPAGVAPLYKFLKGTSPEGTGQRVSWNFEKFLVGPEGNVLRRYKPGIFPEQIEGDVEWALKHPGVGLPPKKKPSLGVE